MGLTFNLGRVSPSVFTDSSLNVGIGAAPSGTYKFEVTGTAKVGSLAIAATGQVFIGTTTALFNSQVNINYNQSTYEGLAISTDKIYNGSPQPNLIFGGKYNSAGDYRQFATLQSIKDNATSGDSAASLVFNTNGNSASPTERMRITSAGDVAIGTSSVTYSAAGRGYLAINGTSDSILEFKVNNIASSYLISTATQLEINANDSRAIQFNTNSNERMRISSGGNLFLGTLSDREKFNLNGNTALINFDTYSTSLSRSIIYYSNTISYGLQPIANINFLTQGDAASAMTFTTRADAGNYTERLRISPGGYTRMSNNGVYYNSVGPWHEIRQSIADWTLVFSNSNATSPNGLYMEYTASTPNNTGSEFLYCRDATALRFRLASNGNCYNVTGTYTSGVSDINYKEQIVDANSQWDDIKNLRVVNFKFIKDVEENGDNALRQIGFIAQEVEKTSPNLIEEMTDKETGETWKTIKASIIHTKAIKALQEAMARIEILEERLNKAGL